MGRKKFRPKDMRDLENIYYDPKQTERKRKYESFIDAGPLNDVREAKAKQIMSNFGESVKIPTDLFKRPDFKIQESKLVYEITSIQCSEQERVIQTIQQRTEQDFVMDVNKAIEHGLEKDYASYQDYMKVLLMFIDTILATLCNYTVYAATPSVIGQTIFPDSNLDCIILVPSPSSVSDEMPHVAFAKDEYIVKMLRKKLPEGFTIFQI